MKHSRALSVLASLVLLSLTVAACGGDALPAETSASHASASHARMAPLFDASGHVLRDAQSGAPIYELSAQASHEKVAPLFNACGTVRRCPCTGCPCSGCPVYRMKKGKTNVLVSCPEREHP